LPELSNFFAINSIKGFLAENEGEALFELACDTSLIGPCLEIGSYCGKSTVYLGEACRRTGNTLYAVDHHRGSEEHQRGEEYHDASLYDPTTMCMDSFPAFRETLKLADLENTVVPIVSPSAVAAKHWNTPLGLVFIDGGHSHESSMLDCRIWSEKLSKNGVLAVHDIFENPEDGGQGPYLALQALLSSGQYESIKQVGSLGVLRKK